jgi:ElaB/YqjD/DUF883 family membrane-anchored ribosome-binding protein
MPTTYAFWADRLERFSRGDDRVLSELADATLAWQPGVAERVTSRISQAFSQRLEELRRRLQRDLDTPSGDLGQLGQALSQAKRALSPLVRLTTLPSLPVEVRTHLDAELRRIVEELQESLECSARPDTDIGVRILAQLRHHRLTAALNALAPQPAPQAIQPGEPLVPGRRPLIF